MVSSLHDISNSIGPQTPFRLFATPSTLANNSGNVAYLVGIALDATSAHTFRGEMAYQLDGGRQGNLYSLIAKNDNEVIQPLANEGAEVSCQVVILAKGDAAIRENTVELGIKESLSQRDIEADIQTG